MGWEEEGEEGEEEGREKSVECACCPHHERYGCRVNITSAENVGSSKWPSCSGGRPSLSIIKTCSLRRYLHSKIESGDAHSISCTEYGCYKLVPVVSQPSTCVLTGR